MNAENSKRLKGGKKIQFRSSGSPGFLPSAIMRIKLLYSLGLAVLINYESKLDPSCQVNDILGSGLSSLVLECGPSDLN